ncbi:MAG: hypothetical protein KDE27_08015 [Planctomycetes bacterium]|nr:hypothetical protein [Planctomycetota bacterium]
MTRPRPRLLQRPVQIAIWLLMTLALIGPHTHWSVCTTGKCRPQPVAIAVATPVEASAPSEHACACCAHKHAPQRDRGKVENRADGCAGCCVDLAIDIDEGPLPQPVTVPDLTPGHAAIPPSLAPFASSARAARFQGHDTGPPRVDRTTSLLATTILRE